MSEKETLKEILNTLAIQDIHIYCFLKRLPIHHMILRILISTQIQNLKQKKILKHTMKSSILIKRISFVNVQRQNTTLRVILVEVVAVKATNLIVLYCKKQVIHTKTRR